jgi:predicted O-methyltransferase YrrM
VHDLPRRRLDLLRRLRPRASVHTSDRIASAFVPTITEIDYYEGVLVGAETIGRLSLSADVQDRALAAVSRLTPDSYVDYVNEFVQAGRGLGRREWVYGDIATSLTAASMTLKPSSYLEIGVRRGRSMAVVASTVPSCAIVGIDLWIPNYAEMDSPGPDYVREELRRVGHTGTVELISGDSHKVLPELLQKRPYLTFDLITVDGDHSPQGARRDLNDTLPRLRIGGAVVFDDIAHPLHPQLLKVWRRTVASDPRYSSWEFDDVGYGVAIAVRRW